MSIGKSDAGLERVEQALAKLYEAADAAGQIKVPKGYPHLGLAVIDSVFSLRTRYGTVVNVLDAYCARVPMLAEEGARFEAAIPSHDIGQLLTKARGRTEDELCGLFGGNTQFAPGTRIRKAVVVRNVAERLHELDVITSDDLRRKWQDEGVAKGVLEVRGVGHAAWRYILTLSLIEKVKPDTMITAWVREAAADMSLTPVETSDLLEQAAQRLSVGRPELTIRAADHLVWRQQSKRLNLA